MKQLSDLKQWWADWATVGGLAGAAGLLTLLEPVRRSFSLTDPKLAYPYLANDTIPEWLCLVSLP